MGRADLLPGPGGLRVPDPDCRYYDGDGEAWCLEHELPWEECGGLPRTPFDEEPF